MHFPVPCLVAGTKMLSVQLFRHRHLIRALQQSSHDELILWGNKGLLATHKKSVINKTLHTLKPVTPWGCFLLDKPCRSTSKSPPKPTQGMNHECGQSQLEFYPILFHCNTSLILSKHTTFSFRAFCAGFRGWRGFGKSDVTVEYHITLLPFWLLSVYGSSISRHSMQIQ